MRKFIFKEKYNKLIQELIDDYEKNNGVKYIIGPDCVCLLEILCEKMPLKSGMRVLDMGCGAGFTSIILAKEFGVNVFANDLWFDPSDNYKRFIKASVDNLVIPIQAEARNLPYAKEFFDIIISIDAYHYFGTDEMYFYDHYYKLAKKSGHYGIIVPGLKKEFTNGIHKTLQKHWLPDMNTFHSIKWWTNMWGKTDLVDILCAEEIPNGKDLWKLTADFELHEADKNDYLTLLLMTARKK